jgi:hypothetical protein
MPMYVVNGSGGSGKSRWTQRLLDGVLVLKAPRQQRPRDKHQQKRKPKS